MRLIKAFLFKKTARRFLLAVFLALIVILLIIIGFGIIGLVLLILVLVLIFILILVIHYCLPLVIIAFYRIDSISKESVFILAPK